MRNHSTKYHLPTKEVTRIVRFNGKDYLLSSIYDDAVEFDFDKEYEKTKKTEKPERLPWFDKAFRQSRRINESFFDDESENFFDDVESIENALSQDNDVNNYYVIYNASGERMEILLSEDNIKNAVFYLFINFMIISNNMSQNDLKSVDQILYTSGSVNDVKSYKMNISGIKYENGSYKLIYGGIESGYIQVYFVDNNNIEFSIIYPGISMRNKSQLSSFSYADFCDFMKYDRFSLKDKEPLNYYEPVLKKLIAQYQKYNINMTVCNNKHTGDKLTKYNVIGPNELKTNLGVLYKFKGDTYDFNKLWQCVVDDSQNISDCYENDNYKDLYDDEYYVMIGGHERYVANLKKSVWFNDAGAFQNNQYTSLYFTTPNKDVPDIKEPHNMLIIPLSRFVLGSPALLTHLI